MFFFQAEDGIRDVAVTGVQTCALPIWLRHRSFDPNRITNGSFEDDILAGGLDWRVLPTEGVIVDVDSRAFFDGVRSLRIRFDGKHNVSYSHVRSEEHTSELQSRLHLVCRLLLEKKKKTN